MTVITATELARNLSHVLDKLATKGGEIIVERNHEQVARIIPGRGHQTALEAMGDLYRTLPEDVAVDWVQDSKEHTLDDQSVGGIRDPWVS